MKMYVFFIALMFVLGCSKSAEQGAGQTLDNANSAIGSVADSVSGKIWVPRGSQPANAEDKKEEEKK